jgi:hypothetical protein
MTRNHWQLSAIACAFAVLVLLLAGGCGSVQINVGEGREGSIGHPLLASCPGAALTLTVLQNGKRATASGLVVGGQVKFENQDLSAIDYSQPLTVELKVVKAASAGSSAGDCPFHVGDLYKTGFVVLTKLAPGKYALDADKFEKQ